MWVHRLFKGFVHFSGAVGLAGAILWQVIQSTGQDHCQAIVHVSELGAEVVIDDMVRRVESMEELPFVFPLRPGKHRAYLLKDGVAVDDQPFELAPEKEIVLVLWDAKQNAGAGTPNVPASVVYGDRSGQAREQQAAIRPPRGSWAWAENQRQAERTRSASSSGNASQKICERGNADIEAVGTRDGFNRGATEARECEWISKDGKRCATQAIDVK
jgi:hypothetical protein